MMICICYVSPAKLPSFFQIKGWEVLPHPPYLSYLAPADFHLFRSLEDLKINIRTLLEETVDLFKLRIEGVTTCWSTMVENESNFTFLDLDRFPLLSFSYILWWNVISFRKTLRTCTHTHIHTHILLILGLENTPTASQLRDKTPPSTSVFDITLNNLRGRLQ